ncbi:unnamed protein product [Camellia sinensis]
MTTFGVRSMSSSSWRTIELAPKDPILGVTEAFLADLSPSKVNVGVISYELYTMRSPEKFGENSSGEWEVQRNLDDRGYRSVCRHFISADVGNIYKVSYKYTHLERISLDGGKSREI